MYASKLPWQYNPLGYVDELTAPSLFTAIIVKIVYGRDVREMNDTYVITAQEALKGMSVTHVPGLFWIEYFPFLRYIPSWVPGAKFKTVANKYRPYVERMRDEPFEATKREMVAF